jgi:Na+-driven multidrug efflux pump
VLITLLACAPITLLWASMGPVMTALGQPAAIVEGAARYLWRVGPAIWLIALQECLKRWVREGNARARARARMGGVPAA